MPSLEAVIVLFLCSGLTTMLSFVITVVIRAIQYRTYYKGKYYGRFMKRSALRELLLMIPFVAGVCVLGAFSAMIVGRSPLGARLLIVAALTIGFVALVRMILVGALGRRSLRAQLRLFGVRYPRESVMTGPLRHVTPQMTKLRVDNLDLDDSLPD